MRQEEAFRVLCVCSYVLQDQEAHTNTCGGDGQGEDVCGGG